MPYNNNIKGVSNKPIRSMFVKVEDEPKEKEYIDPQDRKYTLFIYFIEGYDQEKTFEFITGQDVVREYIIANVDIIDFEESLISNWSIKPEDPVNGFRSLKDFILYLEDLGDEDGNYIYNDGFRLGDYLDSLHEIQNMSETERKNYENAVHLSQPGSRLLQAVTSLHEGEEI